MFLLSLLGAGAALFADYMGRAFYTIWQQQSNRYEPKDEERRLFQEERRKQEKRAP